MRDDVGQQDRHNDDGTAHGRGALLRLVGGRAVVANELTVSSCGEPVDEPPRADKGSRMFFTPEPPYPRTQRAPPVPAPGLGML